MVNRLLAQEVTRRISQESIPRIIQCLDLLGDENIHFRPNENCNSVANLILHLDGNVRQWMIAILESSPDIRQRELEFTPQPHLKIIDLKNILIALNKDIDRTVKHLLEMDLTTRYEVQCYRESLLSIVVHVIEHFSYHTGQITYVTKMVCNVDTGYYEGEDL